MPCDREHASYRAPGPSSRTDNERTRRIPLGLRSRTERRARLLNLIWWKLLVCHMHASAFLAPGADVTEQLLINAQLLALMSNQLNNRVIHCEKRRVSRSTDANVRLTIIDPVLPTRRSQRRSTCFCGLVARAKALAARLRAERLTQMCREQPKSTLSSGRGRTADYRL